MGNNKRKNKNKAAAQAQQDTVAAAKDEASAFLSEDFEFLELAKRSYELQDELSMLRKTTDLHQSALIKNPLSQIEFQQDKVITSSDEIKKDYNIVVPVDVNQQTEACEETDDGESSSVDDYYAHGVAYGDHLKSDEEDSGDVYHELVSCVKPSVFVDGSQVLIKDPNAIDQQLHLSLACTDLLTSLYNGSPGSTLQPMYTQIVKILQSEKRIQIHDRHYLLTSESLFEFIRWRMDSVIGTIQSQMIEDNCRPTGCLTKQANDTYAVKPYAGNQKAYDTYLAAVADYFNALNQCSNKMEDIWLMMLEFLKLKNHSQYMLFQRAHYQAYIKLVISRAPFCYVLEEASKHLLSEHASEKLMSNLERVNLKKQSKFVPQPYCKFLRFQYIRHDLSEKARETISREKEEARMRTLAAQNAIRQVKSKESTFKPQKELPNMATINSISAEPLPSFSPESNSCNDCQHEIVPSTPVVEKPFTCKCCQMHHLLNSSGLTKQSRHGQKTQRASTKRATCKQQSTAKQDDPQPEATATQDGNPQVYKKSIDDLLDFINDADKATATKAPSAAAQSAPKKKNKRKQQPKVEEAFSATAAAATSTEVELTVEQFEAAQMALELSDAQFEQSLLEFEQRLESGDLAQVQRKLRPNYSDAWIVQLQHQLQLI